LLPGGSSDSIRLSLEDARRTVTGAAVAPNNPIVPSLEKRLIFAIWHLGDRSRRLFERSVARMNNTKLSAVLSLHKLVIRLHIKSHSFGSHRLSRLSRVVTPTIAE
jgi:hypothetical protein